MKQKKKQNILSTGSFIVSPLGTEKPGVEFKCGTTQRSKENLKLSQDKKGNNRNYSHEKWQNKH